MLKLGLLPILYFIFCREYCEVRGFQDGSDNTTSSVFNRTLVVTSILFPPYLDVKDNSLLGNERYHGYVADLARMLSRKVGFKYQIKLVKDNRYGRLKKNGEWTGMIGEVIRQEADIAIAPTTWNSMREKVVDFSVPFFVAGMGIMIKDPSSDQSFFAFLMPFSVRLWCFILVSFLATVLTLALVTRLSTASHACSCALCPWRRENHRGKKGTRLQIFDHLWFLLAALLQHGTSYEPKSVSSRMVALVWYFFSLVMMAYYLGSIVMILTTARHVLSSITSLEDLARQNQVQFGCLKNGYVYRLLMNSTVPLYQRMWVTMQTSTPSVFVNTNHEGIDRVRTSGGQYAFLTSSDVIDYQNTQQPCDTIRVGEKIGSTFYGLVFPLNSPYKDVIDLAILELRESGELERLYYEWFLNRGSGCRGTAYNVESIFGLFLILACGLFTAVLVSVMESFYLKKYSTKESNSSINHQCTKTEVEKLAQTEAQNEV